MLGEVEFSLERQVMTSDRIIELVTTFYQAAESLNTEILSACFDEDVVAHNPVGLSPIQGLEALQNNFKLLMKLSGTWSVTLELHAIIPGGLGAAVHLKGKALNQEHREVAFERIDVLEFTPEGLIKSLRAYWNPAEIIDRLKAL